MSERKLVFPNENVFRHLSVSDTGAQSKNMQDNNQLNFKAGKQGHTEASANISYYLNNSQMNAIALPFRSIMFHQTSESEPP